jgi:hypothetical protein
MRELILPGISVGPTRVGFSQRSASKSEPCHRHRFVYANGYLGPQRLPRARFDAVTVLILFTILRRACYDASDSDNLPRGRTRYTSRLNIHLDNCHVHSSKGTAGFSLRISRCIFPHPPYGPNLGHQTSDYSRLSRLDSLAAASLIPKNC